MLQKSFVSIFSQSGRTASPDGAKPLGSSVVAIFVLSCLVNTLFLTGPIFMMQVYDRVLGSGNIATLIGLYAIAFLMYVMFGMFDTLRQQIATLRGEEVSAQFDGAAFQASLDAGASGIIDERTNAPEDVDTVRGFITSPGMMTFFDLPAIPFYFLAVMMLHPVLGLVTVGAAAILAGLAMFNDRQSRQRMSDAQKNLAGVSRILGAARQDAESLKANGMTHAAQTYWQSKHEGARGELVSSMRITGAVGSVTKALRLSIQSLVLAVGGWLAVIGQLSPGAMIAASIVFSRSIAPIEQLLNNFRNMSRARDAWARIQTWMPEYMEAKPEAFNLPAPSKTLSADNVAIQIPGQDSPLLTGVATELQAGDVLAIIGPSGVGKTSLVRSIVGAWPVASGTLRLDGAELSQWPADKLGAHIGYLSQYTNLLNGTVAQNIARFRPDATSESVIHAATVASVHEMILGFENGYETYLGEGAVQLSGGQRQRIGLARALFDDPFLMVLDEPSAHLDGPGKIALAQAIFTRSQTGKITIITSHDEVLLKLVTKVLVLEPGRMAMSGPKDAVFARMAEAAALQQAQVPAQPAPEDAADPDLEADGEENSDAIAHADQLPENEGDPDDNEQKSEAEIAA